MASSKRCGLLYGLGTFGDERLKKGGFCCTGHWSMNRARAFAGWVVAGGRARCGSRGFCGIPQ